MILINYCTCRTTIMCIPTHLDGCRAANYMYVACISTAMNNFTKKCSITIAINNFMKICSITKKPVSCHMHTLKLHEHEAYLKIITNVHQTMALANNINLIMPCMANHWHYNNLMFSLLAKDVWSLTGIFVCKTCVMCLRRRVRYHWAIHHLLF